MVSHIFIIHLKHYHIIIIFKTNNFSTIFNIKIWKSNIDYTYSFYEWLQPMFYWIYKCSTLRVQQFFPSKPNFGNFLNFQQQNPLKIHYFPFFSYENCEIKSIKFDSPRDFQQHQEHCQIPIFFFNFYWKNVSIINSFHTIVPNSLKLSWCTPTHCTLSKNIKRNLSVTNQNKLSCFINR